LLVESNVASIQTYRKALRRSSTSARARKFTIGAYGQKIDTEYLHFLRNWTSLIEKKSFGVL